MKHLGELIGYFTIKDDDDIGLFKVYFYEKGISFDKKFLRGIIENEEMYKTFIKINDEWKKGASKENVMTSIENMIESNNEYCNNFFSFGEDLEDESDLTNSSTEFYLKHLKENGKLHKITRKEFEAKIVKEEVGEFYVKILNDTRDNSEFYTYNSEDTNKDFYVMLVDEKIKIGFAEE